MFSNRTIILVFLTLICRVNSRMDQTRLQNCILWSGPARPQLLVSRVKFDGSSRNRHVLKGLVALTSLLLPVIPVSYAEYGPRFGICARLWVIQCF